MSGFVRKGFGTRDVLLVHIVLSSAVRLREPVGSFFWRQKTKDCAAHSMEPPVLLLILQENQETWPRTRGDLAAAHLFPSGTDCYLAAKNSENYHIEGWTEEGRRVAVRLTPAPNYAFDVTPARLVTARGIWPASRDGLLDLFPERRRCGAPPFSSPPTGQEERKG
jgi:hypothetical protein